MVVFSRRLNQSLVLGDGIVVKVEGIGADRVRLCISAPPGVAVEVTEGQGEATGDEALGAPEVSLGQGEQVVVVSPREGGSFVLNGDAEVAVVGIEGDKVRLGVAATHPEAPRPTGSPPKPGQHSSRSCAALRHWIANQIERYLATHPEVTLGNLANQVGVAATSIARWRLGHSNVSRNHLPALLSVLGFTLDAMARELNLSSDELPNIRTRGPAGRKVRARTRAVRSR